ncbi:hypothetical protein EJ02DRAFT_102964 [Clathrospora elynae]|uniref:Uncharacterized protein n=1 Tax=Clathrospora elynae TaxID=706981 RepID=A0A6A5SWQ8_9PLEO|nr:hypothetical protein EJ02DRAFT_102964 [Clathrospora elynae]
MKSVFSLIAKLQAKTFKVSYSPEYKTFIINYVATDPSHPLHETQRRIQAERKKEGLWWHATTGVDLNKSSCVRAWARRRLRNAVKEELKQRGYDETGKFVNLDAIKDRAHLLNVLRQGKTLDLTGGLRLHVQPPLISAKYVDVRAETGKLIEAILQAVTNEASSQASAKKTGSRLQWNPSDAAQRPRVKKMRPNQ